MKLIRIHCHTEQGDIIEEYGLEIHPDLLATFEQMGIVDLREESISLAELNRLHKILRLKQNCGVNTVGAAIIVDLLEKIEMLQDEIERLRRK